MTERRIRELEAENEALKHDIERHIRIVSEVEAERKACNEFLYQAGVERARLEADKAELVAAVNDLRDHGYLRDISCNGRNKTADELVKRLVAAAKAKQS